MWWALLYCMLLPLSLCEIVTSSGLPDINPYVSDDSNTFWSGFCLDTPKIPSHSSHASVEVSLEFDTEVLEDILVYWGNGTEPCVGASYPEATKQISIPIAHNGTSLCNWDIKLLGFGKFIGMVNATSPLTSVTITMEAEEFFNIPHVKPCKPSGGRPPSVPTHDPNIMTSKTSMYEDNYEEFFPSSDKTTNPTEPGSRPFLSALPLLDSLGYIIEDTPGLYPSNRNEATTIFNLLFGISLGACFLVIVMILFFANCAFISGKKKKKPIYSIEQETYYLPPAAFTPPENDPVEYFVQPPPMNVVRPDTVAPSSQFEAFQPSVLTQPIKYFNLLYLLKHVVNTRNPATTESI